MTADHELRIRTAMALAALVLAAPAVAAGQEPAGPPGPPPGNGAQLPGSPGTAPPSVPPGAAAAIPAATRGPGRLNGASVRFDRRRRAFALRLACDAGGRARVTGRGVRGTLASGRYRCAGGRATLRLRTSRRTARRIARRVTVAATAALSAGARIDFTLTTRAKTRAAGYWTDGHLQCSPDGSGAPPAYLVEPDFTTASPTPVSTRGWVAWYTARAGWHWLGAQGERRGPWESWTATATGIAQFHPGGAVQPVPYTWGPIQVPAGEQIRLAGVYEIVYWAGGRPQHRWQYVNAGTTGAVAAGTPTPYCVYP